MLASDDQVKLISTEDGIHLDGSILWFDARLTQDLSFLSSPHLVDAALPSQILTSQESALILEALYRKPDGLVGRFNHPIRIGQLSLELIPSGVGLAGANLLIETGKQKVLYAPLLQLERIAIARHLQLRKADILVLGAKVPYQDSGATHSEHLKAIELVLTNALDDHRPVTLFSGSTPTTQDLITLCNSQDISPFCSQSLEKVNAVYRNYGVQLTVSTKKPDFSAGVQLLPVRKAKRYEKKQESEITIFVADDVVAHERAKASYPWIDQHLVLPAYSSGAAFKEVCDQVNPSKLFFFGPYASEYAKQLSALKPEVSALYPKHLPSLF